MRTLASISEIKTIDEVIDALEEILNWTKDNNSRVGYFPALYYRVTIRIKEGILNGEFEDGKRMERLDVIFAKRYIKAFYQFLEGQEPTKSWALSFELAPKYWLVVLQHMSFGMNAHINLDLGLAAAETSPGENIHGLKDDFNKINEVLGSMVNGVQDKLAKVWWPMRIADKFLGKLDEKIPGFGIGIARGFAWDNAVKFALIDPAEKEDAIRELDKKVAEVGRLIQRPGGYFSFLLKIVRILEIKSISRTIEILETE